MQFAQMAFSAHTLARIYLHAKQQAHALVALFTTGNVKKHPFYLQNSAQNLLSEPQETCLKGKYSACNNRSQPTYIAIQYSLKLNHTIWWPTIQDGEATYYLFVVSPSLRPASQLIQTINII